MHRYFIGCFANLIFFVWVCNCSHGQKMPPVISKPALDTSILGNWPTISYGEITNNGLYIKYIVYTRKSEYCDLIFRSTDGNWKMEIPHAKKNCLFSDDGRMGIFMKRGDSLGLQTMGSAAVEYIRDVETFRLIKYLKREWLIYQVKTPKGKLVIRDLHSSQERAYFSVKDYTLSEDQKVLILHTDTATNAGNQQSLRWMEPIKGTDISIWTGNAVENIVIDKKDSQVCFSVKDKEFTIGYYRLGTEKAITITNDQLTNMDNNLEVTESLGFSEHGNNLLVSLKEKKIKKIDPKLVSVDVWSWTDSKLQSQQLMERENSRSYLALLEIKSKKVTRVQFENEILFGSPNESRSFLLISQMEGEAPDGERNWNPAYRNVILYLVSTHDGHRIPVRKVKGDNGYAYLSPGEQFLVYYDPVQQNYFSYEISTGVTRNITRGIPTEWTIYQNDNPEADRQSYSVEGWLAGDSAVLLHDQFDIWCIDLKGNTPPKCVTNRYGIKHNILFNLLINGNTSQFNSHETIWLIAFNRDTKENGYFSKSLSVNGDPTLMIMDSSLYYIKDGLDEALKKARDANIYLIRRENADKYPAYYCTSDFKTMIPLSDHHPESEYNWMKSELVNWKTDKGMVLRGVLYKPEDFNPQKKYPIIFDIYEKRSDELHRYQIPDLAGDRINIPWFVSRGYLVFKPDIRYTIGEPGESALDAVTSAAKYLSKLPGVDSKKIGIQGHSWGGYEVNYIITHTNIFAAAMSACGISDAVSEYGSLIPADGESKQYFYELHQSRIGATMWERPDLYIKNSPIFGADKVTTPLLMMNNKEDGIIPFSQAVEFFTALRRLRKKVWLLQYDGETHSVSDDRAAMDYTIRMTQFFDHYLMGKPAPVWMTKGIKASEKCIKDGLEIDRENGSRQPAVGSVR